MKKATLILGISLTLLVLSFAFATANDLVLYLPLDGGTEDASGSGNHGIVNGNAIWVNGKYGQAMQFDGATYIGVPDSPGSGFDGVPGLTIEVWVKMSTHHDNGIVVKLTAAGQWWPCSYNMETWSDQLAYFGVNADTGAWATGEYPLDEWFHFAGVFDNGKELVYVNGELGGSVDDPSNTVDDGDLPVYIGCVEPGSYFFVGELDDLAIYSRALTQAEIQQDMESISPATVENTGKLLSIWAAIKTRK